MIALSQVLWLVRELFARQIDRDSEHTHSRGDDDGKEQAAAVG